MQAVSDNEATTNTTDQVLTKSFAGLAFGPKVAGVDQLQAVGHDHLQPQGKHLCGSHCAVVTDLAQAPGNKRKICLTGWKEEGTLFMVFDVTSILGHRADCY